MPIKLKDDRLEVFDEPNIAHENMRKIELLNEDRLFIHPFTNKMGRQLVYYMTNSSYYTLSNPEPVDLSKNTLNVKFAPLVKIDSYIKKPLNEYTYEDFNVFVSAFQNGSVPSSSNVKLNPKAIKSYIKQFKRFWRIYRQYMLNTDPEHYEERFFEWGLNLRTPKSQEKEYEDFPDLNIYQVRRLADSFAKEEYKCRVLLSVNLMGRRCEIHDLQLKHIEEKDDGSVWVKLPKSKKHSSAKTKVELYSYVKKPLQEYIHNNNFREDDNIFPSTDFAFGKMLKKNAYRLFKQNITMKMLRKIGVSVAEDLGYSRADVERIGGWSANSPVIEHYFNRKKGVATRNDKQLEEQFHKDIYVELEKERAARQNLEANMKDMLERYRSDVREAYDFTVRRATDERIFRLMMSLLGMRIGDIKKTHEKNLSRYREYDRFYDADDDNFMTRAMLHSHIVSFMDNEGNLVYQVEFVDEPAAEQSFYVETKLHYLSDLVSRTEVKVAPGKAYLKQLAVQKQLF